MSPFSVSKKIALVCPLLTIAACSNDQAPIAKIVQETPSVRIELSALSADETVLASVNGSKIGSEDLSVYMARTMGTANAAFTDASLEKRVLDSMVTSRAIALKELENLSDEDKRLIEKRVAQFREELLVKRYLLENADPSAISNEDISAYYQNNPDKFKGKKESRYQYLTVSPEHYKSDPAGVIQKISAAKTDGHWHKLSKQLNAEQSQVEYLLNTSSFSNGDNTNALELAVADLAVGKTSKIVFVDGAPFIAKLLSVEQKPMRTLAQVRSEISKKLLPSSLKKSVKEISQKLLAASDIEYFE